MRYASVTEGIFLRRVNRFTADVLLDGAQTRCHVRNTGRLLELLVPGARCVLSAADNPARVTRWDLVGVWRGDVLVNVDSQAPNRAAREWVEAGGLGGMALVRSEYRWGNSRFDLYAERPGERWLIEVKGVTLKVGEEACFPDAPTERGVRHLRELARAVSEGYCACALFVIQMSDVCAFAPNESAHPAFGAALRDAARQGVRIHALTCENAPNEMRIAGEAAVRL